MCVFPGQSPYLDQASWSALPWSLCAMLRWGTFLMWHPRVILETSWQCHELRYMTTKSIDDQTFINQFQSAITQHLLFKIVPSWYWVAVFVVDVDLERTSRCYIIMSKIGIMSKVRSNTTLRLYFIMNQVVWFVRETRQEANLPITGNTIPISWNLLNILRCGFFAILAKILRLRRGALLMGGPPCGSFVWINRATSRRSITRLFGDCSKAYIRAANAKLTTI